MNKIFAILFTTICYTTSVFSQKYQKAVVTDVNYFIESGAMANSDNFPFYFQHPEFITDIQDDIKKYIHEKFGIDTVIFQNPGTIWHSEGFLPPELKARDLAKKQAGKNVLYVGVETVLKEAAIINGTFLYKMITRVKAYKKGGKKVYKFKNQIPFETYRGEEITGHIQMKEQDFYAFYFDGLEMAFSGKVKKVDRRYLEQPPTDFYNDFLNNAEKFYMVRESNGYSYGNNMESLSEILAFKGDLLNAFGKELDLGNLFEGNFINEGYMVKNFLKDKDYRVKLKGGENTLFNFISVSKDIEIDFSDMEKKEVGKFTYKSNDEMNGQFQGDNYQFIWNNEYNVVEVRTDNEKIILINDLGDRKVVFVRKNITEKELGDLYNLIFAYDFALAAKIKAEANASNDRED